MRRYYWLLLLTAFVQYTVSGSSIAEEINFQASNMRQTTAAIAAISNQPISIHMYRDEVIESNQEENIEDAETSASEMIESHALPETPRLETDDVRAAVQRVRRRRRRRRRKRPKQPNTNDAEAGAGVGAETILPTAAVTHAAHTVKAPDGANTLYYTFAQDHVHRKPLKYQHADHAANMVASQPKPPSSQQQRKTVDGYSRGGDGHGDSDSDGDGDGDGDFDTRGNHVRRRVAKRRRRPLKKPIDDYPAAFEDSDETDDKRPRLEKNTPVTTTKNRTEESTSAYESKFPSGVASDTEVANRNKTFTSKETDLKLLKITANHFPEEAENTLKKRKRPAVHKTPQHENVNDEQRTTDVPNLEPEQSRKAVEEELVFKRNKSEEHVKSVENRKELFKVRRLPPTSAILRQAKLRSSPVPPAISRSPPLLSTVSSAPVAILETTTTTTTNTPPPLEESAGNRYEIAAVAEADNVNAKSETYDAVEDKTQNSSAESQKPATPNNGSPDQLAPLSPLSAYQQHQHPDSRHLQHVKPATSKNQSEFVLQADDLTKELFEFPIITYTGRRQQTSSGATTNSTASAFLSGNDDRLAIIYVPCNQSAEITATKQEAGVDNIDNARDYDQTWNVTRQSRTRATSTTQPPNASEIALTTLRPALIRLQTETETSTPNDKSAATIAGSKSASNQREAKHYHQDATSKFESLREEQTQIRKLHHLAAVNPAQQTKSFAGSSREIFISYTSTTNLPSPSPSPSPSSFFSYNDIDVTENRQSQSHSNVLLHRKTLDDGTLTRHKPQLQHQHQQQQQQQQHHQQYAERKKLPLAVKSAIIISGAILALAVLGFFALLLSCKIRQAKSRMKCHRELYRDQFQNSEFRQSSRSTSPVMSKCNYNTRNFTNNIQPNAVAGPISSSPSPAAAAAAAAAAASSNRNYYLWQTLRKTFQYD